MPLFAFREENHFPVAYRKCIDFRYTENLIPVVKIKMLLGQLLLFTLMQMSKFDLLLIQKLLKISDFVHFLKCDLITVNKKKENVFSMAIFALF